MREFYGGIAGLCFGIAIGVAFAWAAQIQHDRETADLAADLNAYRVMAEWNKFEEGRR